MAENQQIDILIGQWLEEATEDTDLIAELKGLTTEEERLDRFYKDLEFGTGGLRGLIGAGTNRINVYTIGKASQGLADYLLKHESDPSVAIAYDSRIKSDRFAREAARVLAANGIQVRIFSELMPTPALSFAVRDLGASAGIVVTASHNPGEYNGYKVYGSDGCQITLEAAEEVLGEIGKLDLFRDVRRISYEEGLERKLIQPIGEDTIEEYLKAVESQSVSPDPAGREGLSIVYTPLNGAGLRCVTTVLERSGFSNLVVVPSQRDPDGRFPTCPYPNPETPEALKEGLAVCLEQGADLLLATDPDCDRAGIAVLDDGDYHLLNGNEVGVLLFDYLCRQRIAAGTMPERPICVKTIVTTEMIRPVARKYGVEVRDVLTGFKFIGEQIGFLERDGEEGRYIFGFEESYGYLSGSYVRDKDAVDACLLIAEMAAFYRRDGKTLVGVLNELYDEHGWYRNTLLNFGFKGQAGMNRMKELMGGLREAPPAKLAGLKVLVRTDYLDSREIAADGSVRKVDLPSSDVLKFHLEEEADLVVRPSGTEPKLKVYLSVPASDPETAGKRTGSLAEAVRSLIQD